ncbi:MoaD/ThiS family protein [Mycobacterium yunnanensis]|uniref:MoaD/ThiS family protein n=1 Tax=Mycobacterium yunnanensis TaxID=368477 RepID=A0A9X3BYI4_9MYCO|nr:MoaD/ThiS family protein [Mycobacterium yunnanensis]MCV7419138.1 MoaD/ThiS family protein [Mycobacterium yunnanensis]
MNVNVRYFAAARAAAEIDGETVTLAPDATVADLVAALRTRGDKLSTVLDRCSFLCDEIAVRDMTKTLETNQTVDVLPPFAGG